MPPTWGCLAAAGTHSIVLASCLISPDDSEQLRWAGRL